MRQNLSHVQNHSTGVILTHADRRPSKRCKREEGKRDSTPIRVPDVGNEATGVGERGGGEGTSEESEDENRGCVLGESTTDLEAGIAKKGDDEERAATIDLRSRAPEERANAISLWEQGLRIGRKEATDRDGLTATKRAIMRMATSREKPNSWIIIWRLTQVKLIPNYDNLNIGLTGMTPEGALEANVALRTRIPPAAVSHHRYQTPQFFGLSGSPSLKWTSQSLSVWMYNISGWPSPGMRTVEQKREH